MGCWTVGVVICLERCADCLHMVQLMPLHPKNPSSLASLKSRLVLPFWHRLIQVVLEKRPLNRCSSGTQAAPCWLGHSNKSLWRWITGAGEYQTWTSSSSSPSLNSSSAPNLRIVFSSSLLNGIVPLLHTHPHTHARQQLLSTNNCNLKSKC